ncbi:DHH family phosphoesterase [Lachnospiraceae bacterium]|nr:DHH family phosphoesterase [Lachnospiraceae bacterium]
MKEEKRAEELLKRYLRWPLIPIILIFPAALAALYMHRRSGVLVSAAALVITVFCLYLLLFARKNIQKAMVQYAVGVDELQKRLSDDLDVAYALTDRSGSFAWKNRAMRMLLKEHNANPGTVEEMFPELPLSEMTKIGESQDFHLTFQDRKFRVRVTRTGEATDRIFAVYLYDETVLIELKEDSDKRRLVAGLLYLDNYEEAMESVDEVRRSLLTAMIDRKIVRYFDGMQAIIKKLEKDKYLFVLEREHLQTLESSQFDILEQVKTVNIGNEMRVTLSIGIGDGGEHYSECYEFARQAIEMALGRGGDQAVVKNHGKLLYFGGNSNSKEKTTRVKARVKAHAFRELIENKDRLFIMGHKMMDIDSLGSAVGIWRIAQTMGKRAHILASTVTSSIKPLMERFTGGEYPDDMFIGEEKALEMLDETSVVVVVDTNRPSIVEAPRLLEAAKTVVVLDHHRQSQDSIRNAQLSYVETYASSACEMVAEIVQYISDDVKLRAAEADAMYAGIVIDTHNFMNQTGVRTFEAAAFLRRNGADVTRVRKLFREKLDDYRAKAEAIHNAEVYRGHYAISCCNSEGLESPTVIGAQAANDLLDIVGIKASIVITEYDGTIYISARSIDEVNVQVMMEKLGGGGHRTIAGAQLTKVSVEEAKEKVKQVLDEMLEKGEII